MPASGSAGNEAGAPGSGESVGEFVLVRTLRGGFQRATAKTQKLEEPQIPSAPTGSPLFQTGTTFGIRSCTDGRGGKSV